MRSISNFKIWEYAKEYYNPEKEVRSECWMD